MAFASILAGFVLLLAGGDALVRGALGVARRLGVSPLLIGLTLVGFGTSMPELVTTVQAALAGSPGIAIGNVVGSNIANILLILGVAAVLSPLACNPRAFVRDGGMIVLATGMGTAVLWSGQVDRAAGSILVAALLVYVVVTYRIERAQPNASAAMHAEEAATAPAPPGRMSTALLLALGGIAAVIVGAHFLVGGAMSVARDLGVSETLLGLTVVAVGTSLPELATSVVAALRRQADIAFGNIVGSNIFNILGILGVTALVRPIPVPVEVMHLDVWVMLGATALLVAFTVTGWRLTRGEGAIFLAGYGAYVWVLAAGVV